jgi:ferritin-like metal-binding protein YciE
MPADQPNVRDAKLIQYLTEAYGNEKRRESALRSQIGMAVRAPYKKRLRGHLVETRRHARELEERIADLGGSVGRLPIPGPGDVAGALLGGMQRATALAQGPLDALRGTSAAERQLRNAKAEFCEEAQEIGTYSAIQMFAERVGDRETAELAGSILRDEQRMSEFLEQEIALQASAVATAEVPARLRHGERRRRATARRPRAVASRGAGARGRSQASSSSGPSAPGESEPHRPGSSAPAALPAMPSAPGPDPQRRPPAAR